MKAVMTEAPDRNTAKSNKLSGDMDAERQRRQRMRSIAIALALGGMVLLFYIATLARLGSNVFNRAI